MDLTKQQSFPQWFEALVEKSTRNAGTNSKSTESIHIPSCQTGNNQQADKGELHEKVQHPKAGTFNYNDLIWSKHPGCTGYVAFIPPFRLEDYLRGEGERSHCSWTTSKVLQPNRDARIRKTRCNTLIFTSTYNCSYGPTDDRGKACLKNPAEKGPSQRRSKVAMGEGVKVGCKAHFRAAIYARNPDIMMLQVYQVGTANANVPNW